MKQFTKYICVFLMMAGMSVSAWGTTTTQVIFPAGTTSSYSAGDWGNHGAYIGDYPSTATTESMCISDGVGFDVKFYYAYDGGSSNGLQLKRNSSAYVEMTIASSNGITVEVTYSATSNFDIELTGASTVTASSSNTTASINTNNTNATLKINGTDAVVYIKYIKITRKSSGTITIGHNDCVVGPNITFGAASVSKTVTPAEAESGGTFSTLRVDGVNIFDGDYDCENWVAYAIENASGASGEYGTDWEFSVVAESSDEAWTCIDHGVGAFSNEALTIYYSFLSEPAPGVYTADLIARTWDDEWNNYDFAITVTLTVAAACTDPTVAFSYNSTVYKATDADAFTRTATAKVGGESTGQTINYSSSNTSIATVSSSGVVTLKGVVGNTTITATAVEDGTYCEGTDSYQVYVYTNPTVNATNFAGVSLTPTSASFKGGQVSNKGGLDITAYGYVIGTSSSVDWSTKVAAAGANGDPGLNTDYGTLSTTTDLTPGTQYYVRVFAYNGKAFGYSTYGSFKTPYAITLNKNNSDLSGSTSGSAYILPDGTSFRSGFTPPTREHYTVEGYYTTSDCTVKIATDEGALQANVEVSSTTWTNGSSQWKRGAGETFYAKWIPVNYTISFNSNGGSGSMSSVEKAYNSSYSLPSCTFTPPSGKVFDHWGAGSAGGTSYDVDDSYTVTGDITFYAVWKDGTPTDLVFSCAELEITGPTGNLIFITSAASKTVRSQEAFHIEGSGLSVSQSITFTHSNSTIASKFAYKTSDGTALATDASGEIDTDFYIYYTPGAGDTDDGLDVFTNLQAKVTEGLKPKASNILSTKTIIGRHLPADFVIAAKNTTTNKWYALPANMSGTGNPTPVEIAVDDIDNPTIAYTASSNIYNLYLSADKEKVQLGMKNNVNESSKSYALWANNADKSNDIGKNTGLAESTLGDNYKWTLAQTNTSITNAKDAKYTISNPNNANALKAWFAAGGGPKWGLYSSGEATLRIIPASAVEYTASEVVAWGQKKLILEVAKPDLATQARAKIGDGSWSAYKSLATTTGTSKGTATKYNYTLDFTDDSFDFSAHEGEMLIVELHNAVGSALKATSVIIPRIVAADRTINKKNDGTKGPWNTEVHVLPGVTLTLDASAYDPQDMTFKELNIYPGATVVAEKGTLKATTLILRNGWDRLSATKTYDVARLYITPTNGSLNATTAYADWYIDFDQYYPIAVPWEVDLGENNGSTICYKNTKTNAIIGLSTTVRLRYYDGESRAKGLGDASKRENWKHYGESGCEDIPKKLEPSKAYAMTAKRPTGKAFSIIRMPLTIPSTTWTSAGEKGSVDATHKDQVTVTAYNNDAGDAAEWARGWNFIANPYMSLYQGPITHSAGSAYNVEYANIPDINFNEYEQYPIGVDLTKLKPASGFLIQTEADGTLTFNTDNRKASAPSYRTEEAPQASKQKAYILLSDQEANDMMGLIISDQYTAEYEMNADLEKLLGDGTSLKTYMRYNEMNMAYVAINETLAKEWIPVSVRIPETGVYTFSIHEASIADELEGVYLIDYQNGDQVTNLLADSYTFTANAGTISNRFAINAKVGERETPTAIDVVGMDKDSKEPIKFLWHDKVFIWFNGVIYDATGKKVR